MVSSTSLGPAAVECTRRYATAGAASVLAVGTRPPLRRRLARKLELAS
jgi:hypothetical protein